MIASTSRSDAFPGWFIKMQWNPNSFLPGIFHKTELSFLIRISSFGKHIKDPNFMDAYPEYLEKIPTKRNLT